jgi:hypothetical protein
MDSANTFNSIKPTLKDSYADEKPKKFGKMRKALKGISLSMHKASKDPRKYIDEQDKGIKNFKGIVS